MILEEVKRKLSTIAKPMLLEKTNECFISQLENYGYLASRKFDGVRVLAIKENDKIILKGRSGYTYEEKFKEIVEALSFLPNGTILDGEMCCDTFQHAQARTLTKDKLKSSELQKLYPATYHIFDILGCDYEDLCNFPLNYRLEKLRGVFVSRGKLGDCGGVYPLNLVENSHDIQELWEKAQKEKWEGVVLKNPNSHYEFKRSKSWLKLKCLSQRVLEFDVYTTNNAGVRAVSREGICVQIGGKENSSKFIQQFEKNGVVKVNVEFLEEMESGMLRMAVCKEVL